MQQEREVVHRNGPHKRSRTYVFRTAVRPGWGRMALAACLCAAILFSAFHLVNYAADYVRARNASGDLRGMYYGPAGETAPLATASMTPVMTPAQTQMMTMPIAVAAAPQPSETPMPKRLPVVRYPDNPLLRVAERFARLRSEYGDVVAWLTIDGLLDEAVVQRDNIYYMTRDFRGRNNVNGALFLDEFVQLNTRPYTLIIYGHNMKTGAMFGSLRNYENLAFYRRNPFITCNTMYEAGRYVIFSVTRLSVDAEDERYFDIDSLDVRAPQRRSEAIQMLQQCSLIDAGIDVRPDDQLLLLLTCVEAETDRRIVAARRIRPGETEEALLMQAAQAVRQ